MHHIGSQRLKIVPIQFNTGFLDNQCSFQWSCVAQPSNRTKETGESLAEMFLQALKEHPKLVSLGTNAGNTDCGGTECSLIGLQRQIYELLLWVKDPSHCLDTVCGTAMHETFGCGLINYGKGKPQRQSLVPSVLKFTNKVILHSPSVDKEVLKPCVPGQYQSVAANCGTRMRSNGLTAEAMFTKRKVPDKDLKFYEPKSHDLSLTESKEPKSHDLLHDFALGLNQDRASLVSTIDQNISTIDDMFDCKDGSEDEDELFLPTLTEKASDEEIDRVTDLNHDDHEEIRYNVTNDTQVQKDENFRYDNDVYANGIK
eukprot:842123_1